MSAVILAGGKSSRMGRDKALLKLGAKTLLENLLAVVNPLFKESLVIVDNRAKLEGLHLEGAKIQEDWVKGQGPLAAIYTGLLYSRHAASCVLTCDMPLIDQSILMDLVELWEEDQDVICFKDPGGNDQPFPGIYSRLSRHLMRLLLDRGENSMKRYFQVAIVKPCVLAEARAELLTNMNSPEDYERVLRGKSEWAKG